MLPVFLNNALIRALHFLEFTLHHYRAIGQFVATDHASS